MPQNKFALARYRLIDCVLREEGYVKTSEIVEMCRDQLGMNVTKRTIQMDLDAMSNDSFLGYHLPICYCKRRKVYYYSGVPDTIVKSLFVSRKEILLLQELKEDLQGKISPETYQVYCALLNRMQYV